jgi:hypothetical protein
MGCKWKQYLSLLGDAFKWEGLVLCLISSCCLDGAWGAILVHKVMLQSNKVEGPWVPVDWCTLYTSTRLFKDISSFMGKPPLLWVFCHLQADVISTLLKTYIDIAFIQIHKTLPLVHCLLPLIQLILMLSCCAWSFSLNDNTCPSQSLSLFFKPLSHPDSLCYT